MSVKWVLLVSARFEKDVTEMVVTMHQSPHTPGENHMIQLVPVVLPDGPVEPTNDWIRETLVSLIEGL